MKKIDEVKKKIREKKIQTRKNTQNINFLKIIKQISSKKTFEKKNEKISFHFAQAVRRNETGFGFSVPFRDQNGINFEILVSKSRRDGTAIYSASFLKVPLFRIIFLSYMKTLFTYYTYISHRNITHIYHS